MTDAELVRAIGVLLDAMPATRNQGYHPVMRVICTVLGRVVQRQDALEAALARQVGPGPVEIEVRAALPQLEFDLGSKVVAAGLQEVGNSIPRPRGRPRRAENSVGANTFHNGYYMTGFSQIVATGYGRVPLKPAEN